MCSSCEEPAENNAGYSLKNIHVYYAETRPLIHCTFPPILYHDVTDCITYRLHAHVTNMSQCDIGAHCPA